VNFIVCVAYVGILYFWESVDLFSIKFTEMISLLDSLTTKKISYVCLFISIWCISKPLIKPNKYAVIIILNLIQLSVKFFNLFSWLVMVGCCIGEYYLSLVRVVNVCLNCLLKIFLNFKLFKFVCIICIVLYGLKLSVFLKSIMVLTFWYIETTSKD